MYYLVWRHEIIEDDIATKEEAVYLQQEYVLAYGGVVQTFLSKRTKHDNNYKQY